MSSVRRTPRAGYAIANRRGPVVPTTMRPTRAIGTTISRRGSSCLSSALVSSSSSEPLTLSNSSADTATTTSSYSGVASSLVSVTDSENTRGVLQELRAALTHRRRTFNRGDMHDLLQDIHRRFLYQNGEADIQRMRNDPLYSSYLNTLAAITEDALAIYYLLFTQQAALTIKNSSNQVNVLPGEMTPGRQQQYRGEPEPSSHETSATSFSVTPDHHSFSSRDVPNRKQKARQNSDILLGRVALSNGDDGNDGSNVDSVAPPLVITFNDSSADYGFHNTNNSTSGNTRSSRTVDDNTDSDTSSFDADEPALLLRNQRVQQQQQRKDRGVIQSPRTTLLWQQKQGHSAVALSPTTQVAMEGPCLDPATTPNATCTIRAGLRHRGQTFTIDRQFMDVQDIRIGSLLGEGSYGSTYHSCYFKSCRAVVKFGVTMTRDEYLIGKYMGQLGIGPRVFATFQCPAQCQQTGDIVELCVIVMEQLDMTLDRYLKHFKATKQDANNLAHLLQLFSETGAIHHDLKANNIMVRWNDDDATATVAKPPRFYLIDFGTTYFPLRLSERLNATTGEWHVVLANTNNKKHQHDHDNQIIPYNPQLYCRSVWVREAPPADDSILRHLWDMLVLYVYLEQAYKPEWVDNSSFMEQYRYNFVKIHGRQHYWRDAGISAMQYLHTKGVCGV